MDHQSQAGNLGGLPGAASTNFAGGHHASAKRDTAPARRVIDILNKVQEITKTGVWEYNPTTKETTWTPEMYRIHGIDEDFPLEFERVLALYPEADRARIEASIASLLETREASSIELQIMTPAGQRTLRSLAFPQIEGGLVTHIIGYVTDITETKAVSTARKALEERERELERVNDLARRGMDLLRSTAHELNTPLTPLRLAVASLRKSQNLEAREGQTLQLIDRNVLRLSSLVQDMLDAARLQGGHLKIKPASSDLQAMVEECVHTFQDAAHKAGLDLQASVPDGLVVDVDRQKTMQVLFNLVSNAIKYTPNGKIKVTAAVQDGRAVVSVTDTGLGLTASQQARLFQPFVRLHEAEGNIQGTGLGLYISKGIIELQGGQIWAESPGAGQGTTFHVSLPTAKDPKGKQAT